MRIHFKTMLFVGFVATTFACSSTPSSSSGNSSTCDPTGSWAVNFQWSGRTPGALTLDISGSSVQQLSGPGVSAANGSISVFGHEFTWTLSDGSTWKGAVDSTCTSIAAGSMTSSTGNPGTFSAEKQGSPGGNEACGISFKSASCASCIQSSCCSVTQACANDSACTQIIACVQGCNQNTTCEDNCITSAPSNAQTEISNASNCWATCNGSGC